MHKGKYVFAQLLDFLDHNDFNYLVMKYVVTNMSSSSPVITNFAY